MDETGKLYFIEVNAAHSGGASPSPRRFTRTDLVKSQILIAAGYKLPEIISQPIVFSRPRHRVPHQCRESGHICSVAGANYGAESARGTSGFAWTTAVYTDYVISAVLRFAGGEAGVVRPRPAARRSCGLRRAPRNVSWWRESTRPFPLHQKVLSDPDFVAGKVDTTFLNRYAKR